VVYAICYIYVIYRNARFDRRLSLNLASWRTLAASVGQTLSYTFFSLSGLYRSRFAHIFHCN